MSKQLLTLGIILSLGTVGCAGFGVQQGSSLTARLQHEQGLDNLWSSSEPAPTEGLDAPAYADQGLGNLWVSTEHTETAGGERRFYTNRNLGNLWSSAF
jgi:hypothetical protein